jgi:hypothetical protein
MMTFFQPPVMTDQQFDHAMKEMDIEMAKTERDSRAVTRRAGLTT